MSRRSAQRRLPVKAGAATVFLLGACAQAPAPEGGDPVYNTLAPRAEVLARNTVQEALETARSSTTLSWSYVEDGSRGEITPLRTYRTSAGFYCREYVEVVDAGDEGQSRRQRTACRDEDGLWKPVRS
jgi:surface antigen